MRQVVVPHQTGARQHDGSTRQQHDRQPARRARPGRQSRQMVFARLEIGQQPARGQAGGQRAGGGQQAQLAQSFQVGQQHEQCAQRRGQHGQPQGVADAPGRGGERLADRTVGEQIGRIIHRFADENCAKCQGDAMNRAEPRADRSRANQQAGQQRDETVGDGLPGTVRQPQNQRDQHDGQHGGALRGALDLLARFGGKHRSPAQLQSSRTDAAVSGAEAGRKSVPDAGNSAFLRTRIHPRCPAIGQQQGALSVLRRPHAMLDVRWILPRQRLQQRQHGAAGVSR